MTPSTIFQWPLSPTGTFQPSKSRPLKSGVNFVSCAEPADCAEVNAHAAAQMGSISIQGWSFMTVSLRRFSPQLSARHLPDPGLRVINEEIQHLYGAARFWL